MQGNQSINRPTSKLCWNTINQSINGYNHWPYQNKPLINSDCQCKESFSCHRDSEEICVYARKKRYIFVERVQIWKRRSTIPFSLPISNFRLFFNYISFPDHNRSIDGENLTGRVKNRAGPDSDFPFQIRLLWNHRFGKNGDATLSAKEEKMMFKQPNQAINPRVKCIDLTYSTKWRNFTQKSPPRTKDNIFTSALQAVPRILSLPVTTPWRKILIKKKFLL